MMTKASYGWKPSQQISAQRLCTSPLDEQSSILIEYLEAA